MSSKFTLVNMCTVFFWSDVSLLLAQWRVEYDESDGCVEPFVRWLKIMGSYPLNRRGISAGRC